MIRLFAGNSGGARGCREPEVAWSRGPPDREDRIGCRPRGARAASSRARGGTLRLAGKSDTRKLVAKGRSRSLDHIRSGRPLCRRRRKPAGTGAGPFRRDQRSLRIFLRLRQRNFRRSRGEDDATGDGAGVAVVGLSRRQSFARPWRLNWSSATFRHIERPGGLRSSRIIAFERLDPGAVLDQEKAPLRSWEPGLQPNLSFRARKFVDFNWIGEPLG